MMLLKNVLVTGCGGDIGIALGRILRDAQVAERIYGCDILDEHPGRIFFDECMLMERADSPNYFQRLMDLVVQNDINLVIPAAEPELRVITENNFYGKPDLFLTANIEAMRIGFDKYATIEMLKNIGLPHPWTVDASKSMPVSYPCVWKSRTGCGSKLIRVLQSPMDIFESNNGIYQEFIPDDEGEYTCGVYCNGNDEIRTVIFKRKLRGGLTGSGEVVDNKAVKKILIDIAKAVELKGSINVQLRLKAGVPYVFEINPRFSSTVMFRHKLGFKDLLWSIQDRVGHAAEKYEAIPSGIKFYKVYEDMIDWSTDTSTAEIGDC